MAVNVLRVMGCEYLDGQLIRVFKRSALNEISRGYTVLLESNFIQRIENT